MFKQITACIIFCITLLSCSPEGKNLSVSNWQVLYVQSEQFELIKDASDWQEIDIRDPLSLPYPEKKIFQYIWLKGEFTASADYKSLYGISFDLISMVDRVYINGNLVGYLEKEEANSLDGPRNYPISPGIIHQGKNTIYIRAGAYDEWDVEISDRIYIQDAESFREYRKRSHLTSEIIPLAILTLIIGTFFSLLFKSANEKWNREYLILAGRLLIVILCYLTFYSPIALFTIKAILAIWKAALPLLCITMFLLYQEICRVRFERFNLSLITGLTAVSCAVFLLNYINVPEIIAYSILLLSLLTALFFTIFIFTKILKNRQRGFKLILVLSDGILINLNIGIVSLFLIFNITVIDPSLFSIVSSLILTILFSIYFARREGLQKQKLEGLQIRLNDIESGAQETQKYSISPALEQKLETITAFIRENHSSVISREELAESVGVNPNYFSSLFNLYTGKKVNEYINDLRLEKAAGNLIYKDDSVIDIAFSSGFESLSTFNRLFRKKFDCSPKEYRNRHQSTEK